MSGPGLPLRGDVRKSAGRALMVFAPFDFDGVGAGVDIPGVISAVQTIAGRLSGLSPDQIGQDLRDLHTLMEAIRRSHGSVESFARVALNARQR